MKVIKLLIIICICGMLVPVGIAQETGDGQVCVRAFEDRNANGEFDPNEPPITQGIGVNLLNIQNVTIASALLEDSESAALGTVCFRELFAGDYTVVVTSADYTATTQTTFNALVVPQAVPTRLDFGGQVITTGTTETTATQDTGITPEQQDRALQGLLFGVLGAGVVMFVMVIAGVFIYFAVFRRRMKRIMEQHPTGSFRPVTGPMPAYQQAGTGPMPAVRPDTDAYRPIDTGAEPEPPANPNNPLLTRDPNEGSPPLFDDEDTDQMGSV